MKGWLLSLLLAAICVGGCTSILGVDFDNAHYLQTGDDGGESDVYEASAVDRRPPLGDAQPDADAGPACSSDKKLCNALCVGIVDPLFGCTPTSCIPCSVPYATAACTTGACAIGQCAANRADCDQMVADGCEVNLQTAHDHCGTCTMNCGTDVCSQGTCAPICMPGYTNCSGSCVLLSSDPNNCGICGKMCPPVTDGVPTCTASACGAACNAGFHYCGGQCVPDSPTACGPSCTVCTVPANGSATCSGGVCGEVCNGGFDLCGAQCLLNSPTACGPSCTVCPVPANATATCSPSGVCGFNCNSGFNLCAGACVANSPSSCGASCAVCPAPANGLSTCSGAGQCGFVCDTGFSVCGSSCCPNDAGTDSGTDGGSTCAHPICTAGVSLISGCDPCVTLICASDGFCCDQQIGVWDSTCVGEVTSICGLGCPDGG